MDLAAKIAAKTAIVGVIGLGYVGLPTVRLYLNAGFKCLGFDTDGAKIEQLRQGACYLHHVPSDWIALALREGRFVPLEDFERLADADVLLICVPTPLTDTRDPDLQFVEGTARQIARTLRPGQLVILQSTSYPGTTREVVLPILASTSLRSGSDFLLAFGSEREDPGNREFSGVDIPKVVGGIDGESLVMAELFFRQAYRQVIPVSSCEVAEASKILENTYRAVNIALVNDLKILFHQMGIDVWEVIEAAKTKPFGFQAFYPGPGLGGHCIPVDPFYLSWLSRRHGAPARFVELAGEINSAMPEYVYHRTVEALNSQGKPVRGSKVLVLGIAYKPDVGDPRGSPAYPILERLIQTGATVLYHDPFIPVLSKARDYDLPKMVSSPLSVRLLNQQDCALIVTDHSFYDWELIVRNAPLVIDTRNATRKVVGRDNVWLA